MGDRISVLLAIGGMKNEWRYEKMDKLKVCESCGAFSDYKLVNEKIICMGCGQLMIKEKKAEQRSPVPAPAEAIEKAFVRRLAFDA